MDVVYCLDSSGSIGEEDFQTELDWVVQMLDSALPQDARTGFIRFASRTNDLLGIEESDSMTIPERQSFVEDISYTAGWTDTTGALDNSIAMFDGESNDQISKLLIMITDGNPNAPDGDNNVCSRSQDLKSREITVVIIGVGDEWDPAKLDCLVTDDSYIIKADDYSQESFDELMPALTDVTCPVEYDLILTEVQLEKKSDGSGSRFVEIWNRGGSVTLRDVMLEGIFSGQISDDDGELHLNQSQYLVLYDKSADEPNCQDCGCNMTDNGQHHFCVDAVYVECCTDQDCPCQFSGDDMDNEHWNMTFIDSTNSNDIDDMSYDNRTWPKIFQGYSYTLKYNGYDHEKGANWRQSCNARGTPGSDPIDDCDWTCTDDECQMNGDSNAQCNRDDTECECSNHHHYYFTGHTCQSVPKTGECYAHWLYNDTNGQKSVKYIWDKPQTDSEVNYTLTYPTTRGSNDKVVTSWRTKTVFDFGKYDDYDGIAGYVQTNIDGVLSKRTECQSQSMAPTLRPTSNPTSSPTANPSMSPTSRPTFSMPRLYFSGDLCEFDRCECYQRDWSCEGTEEIHKDYAASSDDQYISVTKWPRDYPFKLEIDWHIELINSHYTGRNNSESDESSSQNRRRRRLLSSVLEQMLHNEEGDSSTMKKISNEEMNSILVQRNLLNTDEDNSDDSSSDYASSTSTMDPQQFGIHPRKGTLLFNGSMDEVEKIVIQIEKKSLSDSDDDPSNDEDERYKLYRITLEGCENDYHRQDCELVYPKSFYMVVDITGGGDTLNSHSKSRVFPWWIWWVIIALLIFLAILAAMVYRYRAKNEETKSQLLETEQELDRAFESNELGFGHDLGAGDITFNPIATATPSAVKAPPMVNQFIIDQKDDVHLDRSDVITEKFDMKSEFGGMQPTRKPQIGTDMSPLLG